MLTHKQLLWFNDSEKTGMNNWYAAGHRGKPWSKVTTFDSKKFWKVAEAAKESIDEELSKAVIPLKGLSESDTMFFCYVGLTGLPQSGPKWMTQEQMQEEMLTPNAHHISKALFTVASEGEDHLYIVVNKYREKEQAGKLIWEKPIFAALPIPAVQSDETIIDFLASVASTGDMDNMMAGMADVLSTRAPDMPSDMIAAGLARGAAQSLTEAGFQVTARRDPKLRLIWSDMEKMGIKFYGENDG